MMLTILTGHSFSVDVSSDIFHIYPHGIRMMYVCMEIHVKGL
jgi:hypothetical protein